MNKEMSSKYQFLEGISDLIPHSPSRRSSLIKHSGGLFQRNGSTEENSAVILHSQIRNNLFLKKSNIEQSIITSQHNKTQHNTMQHDKTHPKACLNLNSSPALLRSVTGINFNIKRKTLVKITAGCL